MSDDLTENYRGAFDGSLGFGKAPALILVDFVEAYFDEQSPLYANVGIALSSALRIREAARAAGIPVFYTNVVYEEGGGDGGVFYRKVPALEVFVAGSPLGNWPEGLQPAKDEIVISKQYPSAFFGTSLADELTKRGIDTLIITGLTTSGCIRATCVDTMSHGFIPIVVADACGDRHQAPHDANLFDMNAKYGDVVNEKTVIDYLNGL
ncbi:MAG: isochorismatase family protein [Gammaproteobacteria bacterium]|nr:isochorismatase family protein [Gammaproteobacteria bacterium]